LTRALGDRNRFIRWAAVRTLGNLPVEKAATTVTDLAALLDDNDVDVRQAVARALERLGPRARAAVEPLEAKILDHRSDPEFRVAVMYVLESIGTEDTVSAIPLLTRALTDTDARVRRTAAELLGKYGRLAESAVPALRDTLGDDDTEVRQRASDALLSILVGPTKE
jgi:HEAT repeat protein